MKKPISLSLFIFIIILMAGLHSANAQKIKASSSTVMAAPSCESAVGGTGFRRWHHRRHGYVWISPIRVRHHHRGFRGRLF